MNTMPNGHNCEFTQSRMDTFPNRHDPECAKFRIDIITNGRIPNGLNLKWALTLLLYMAFIQQIIIII